MRLRNVWVCALGVCLSATLACGGGEQASSSSATPSSPAAAPAGMKVDESKAGNVTGTVVLEGTAPKNEPIRMNADPTCAKEAGPGQMQETWVVGGDGG